MLQRIRDNASGPMAYAVVGLISLVFGVWGIGSYFTPSANPDVANVGDVQISRYQLQQAYNAEYQRVRQEGGDRFDADSFQPEQLRRQVLQQLVQSAVMDQYAHDAGYRTTDDALLQVLTSDSRFQVNGKFSTQRYEAMLANAGMTPSAYEVRLRRNVVNTQVRAGIAYGAFAAPPAVQHAYDQRKQQRDIAYLLFSAGNYADQIQLTDSDMQAWYDAHKDQYMRPERVKLTYVELDRAALQPEQAPTQDELEALYKSKQRLFSTPDTRDGEQIFVPVTDSNSDQARDAIQSVAAKLKQGESFADVAASAGAEVQLKQLDDVSEAELDDSVGNALFATDLNAVSTPVRSAKGWYLLKPTAENKGETQPFADADVQKKLKQMALQQWQNQQFGELAEEMETLAFQAPNSLDTLAEQLDLKIQHSDWITRAAGSDDGPGQSDVVRKAAFSSAVLDKQLNSAALQLDPSRRVVLRVDDRQAPQQLPLDKVKQQVREQLTANRVAELAQQAAQTARKQLSEGGNSDADDADDVTLQSIADATGASLSSPGYIERSARSVPPAIRQAAFNLTAPDADQTSYRVVRVGDGDAALVALRGVKTAAASADEKIPDAFAQRQRIHLAQLEYAAFATYLNKHADVQINEANLEQQ